MPETDINLIQHYDLLSKLGVLQKLQNYERKVRDQQELLAEAAAIVNSRTVEELLEYTISRLNNKFIPEYLAFIMLDPHEAVKTKIYCYNNLKAIVPPVTIHSLEPFRTFFGKYPNPVSFSLLEYIMDNKEASDALLPLRPEIVVPIMGPGGLNGFIVFGVKLVGSGYDKDEISYINTLMRFASISLQNAVHYRTSVSDIKTNLYNHGFFLLRLEEELAKVRRYSSELSILMLDVDFFKKFNDTWGHLAGDEVLYHTARVVEKSIRKGDIAARFGGEEFSVLLPQSTLASAKAAGERIRSSIEQMVVSYNRKDLRITVSVGISHVIPGADIDSAHLLRQADTALYASKTQGRNRVTCCASGLLARALSKK
ncbi:MAG: GGDEF domain-containing protein [Spirochaetales bacterium]|nr:MAG: GGDEF domain-containing protein [Spirochaetales bacterium]